MSLSGEEFYHVCENLEFLYHKTFVKFQFHIFIVLKIIKVI